MCNKTLQWNVFLKKEYFVNYIVFVLETISLLGEFTLWSLIARTFKFDFLNCDHFLAGTSLSFNSMTSRRKYLMTLIQSRRDFKNAIYAEMSSDIFDNLQFSEIHSRSCYDTYWEKRLHFTNHWTSSLATSSSLHRIQTGSTNIQASSLWLIFTSPLNINTGWLHPRKIAKIFRHLIVPRTKHSVLCHLDYGTLDFITQKSVMQKQCTNFFLVYD